MLAGSWDLSPAVPGDEDWLWTCRGQGCGQPYAVAKAFVSVMSSAEQAIGGIRPTDGYTRRPSKLRSSMRTCCRCFGT